MEITATSRIWTMSVSACASDAWRCICLWDTALNLDSLFHNPQHFVKTCNILPHTTIMYPNLPFWKDFDEKIEVMEQTKFGESIITDARGNMS